MNRIFHAVQMMSVAIAFTFASITYGGSLQKLVEHYSTQKLFALNHQETYSFTLNDGSVRTIRLIEVKDFRDSVVHMMRRAEVDVEIDGELVHLSCAPYIMPTEVKGLRIQADTTSGWRHMEKRVEFSVWDAQDPIVDTDRLAFPLKDYRLFSHGMQAYNEVVHLGEVDGNPNGYVVYHDYGVDMAGYEGREEVVSCTDGKVIKDWYPDGRLCSICIQDPEGLIWDYVHFDSVESDARVGDTVKKGETIGILGKTGPSGNFSHLHLGAYLSMADLEKDWRVTRLNLYPWLVTAYASQITKPEVIAIAQPHQIVLAGEEVEFDGSNSLAFGTKITSYQWVFHDGQKVSGPKATKQFDKAGTYSAGLKVTDDAGYGDVDFCTIKVYEPPVTQTDGLPALFMTFTPTLDITTGKTVRFRIWLQGADEETPISIDFGDGVRLEHYRSYTEKTHQYRRAGIYVVTASCTVNGAPVTQKQKVIVEN